ncbi:hypothetical protein B0O80DRAFT_429767 [Mortierella sp. GBAus27b]|nr:hypothetical protein B0O80DRAFT_429767 [Mortierella sp. GBAus27b]
MVFGNGNIISSPRTLSLLQVIQVASTYLDNARNATDPTVALVFCHDTETSLSQLKKVAKNADDRDTREDIAAIYIGLGKVLDTHGHQEDAQAFYKKSEKWGYGTTLFLHRIALLVWHPLTIAAHLPSVLFTAAGLFILVPQVLFAPSKVHPTPPLQSLGRHLATML